MDHKRYSGILIYNNIYNKNIFSVLDRELGLINVYFKNDKKRFSAVRASLINYRLTKKISIYTACDTDLLALPLEWAREDILFLHHVLELSYNFLSPEQPAQEIFDHLLLLYGSPTILKNCFTKKIYLAKFFSLLGFVNENISSYDPAFYFLISGPIDIMLDRECDPKIHKELTQWLLDCIIIHPWASKFNTVSFLSNTDSI